MCFLWRRWKHEGTVQQQANSLLLFDNANVRSILFVIRMMKLHQCAWNQRLQTIVKPSALTGDGNYLSSSLQIRP